MRKTLPILTLILLLATVSQADSIMTLEDAIATGLQNNYDIQIARNQARIAVNSKGNGTAGFLPSLDASAGYAAVTRETEIDLPTSASETDLGTLSAEVQLTWTLFDGFSMFINRARYNALAELGEAQARNQIENSVVAISRAYFNLVLQEQLLGIARETRDISADRLRRERVRSDLGGASSTDYLNAQVAYNTDQSSLLDRELSVQVAREQLNVLLGQAPDRSFGVVPEIEVPAFAADFSAVMQVALERNASLRAAELNKQLADKDVASARSSFMPRVNAYAAYGYSDQTANGNVGSYASRDVGTETTSSSIGLNLTFNLFNGRRDHIAYQNARIEANNQALARRDAENRLRGQVQESFETLQKRREILTLEEQNIEAARQSLDLQRERFDLGAATSLEFRDAQVSFVRAYTNLISARYEARIALLQLEQLMGTLLTDES